MLIPPLDQKTIEDITRRLVKTQDPREVHLLEPLREDHIDIDILVILDEAGLEGRYLLMSEGHKALIGMKISKSILVYTKEEVEDYSTDRSSPSYLIKKHGKCIYAKL